MSSGDWRDRLKLRIDTEDDFVSMAAADNSLQKAIDKYPDGAPAKVVARCLQLTEAEVETLFQDALRQIRAAL